MAWLLRCAFVVPAVAALTATRTELTAGGNPIRKVVTLLQKMQKKVEADAETADNLYKKFMCYCENSGGDLAASINVAEAKLPELAASLKASTSRKEQLEGDLKIHQKDREAAKAAIGEATSLRKKEKAIHAKELSDGKANLAAVKKAIVAISSGMESFVQTENADALGKIIASRQDMQESDREDVFAFLSGQQRGEYAPASGDIVGILKTMGDEMQIAVDDETAIETTAVKDFEALVAAKTKEIATLSSSIEGKLERVGELGVEIANMKNDAGDTSAALEEDKRFASNMKSNCAEKASVHEAAKKLRADEVVALADTIKTLNNDDALDLFKKTLPSASASFLQVQLSSSALRADALRVLAARPHKPHFDFILLALNGKKVGFSKIVKLIDELVSSLKSEQGDDDDKKDYCAAQLDKTEDKIKGLQHLIADSTTAIDDARERKEKLASEIAALKVGIVALDKALVEATANRKAESAEYKALLSSNTAAKELILFAKNRLNKFYNPKLYRAPPRRDLSEGDQIFVNEGGDIPVEAPGGIANTGISALIQFESDAAPPPPPATAAAYTKKSQESNGVIAMMDILVKDLDQELTEAGVEEKHAQAEYEETVADSAAKRRDDSKSLTDKEAAIADLGNMLEKLADEVKGSGKEEMGAAKYLSNLHSECDWLVQYYDVRKQARTDEIDSLGKARAVLSGADYSLVQESLRTRRIFQHA